MTMVFQHRQTARIGLISDTHMPRLLKALPEALPTLFAEVDVILHAGDVGQLWVLDELSRIAPVIAVHGNDETHEAQQALPFLQTVAIAGRRIVITHGHYPDLQEEHRQRLDDRWLPKLARLASFGRDHGATMVITGHTHVPLMTQFDGVWIINPGTVIQGSEMMRQLNRTVATLVLHPDGGFTLTHLDVEHPGQTYIPDVALEAGFLAARNAVMMPLVAPELEALVPWLVAHIMPYAEQPMRDTFLRLARMRWEAAVVAHVTVPEFAEALHTALATYPDLLDKLQQHPLLARHNTPG